MYPAVKFPRKDPHNFFSTIRKRVNHYFESNEIRKTGNWRMYSKTIIMFSLYVVPYVLMLIFANTFSSWLFIIAYSIMGLGKMGIGLTIMHDANHDSYSRYRWINRLLGHSLTFIGGSAFTWKVQHNLLHHSYTNIYHLDEDINDKPFLRLSPYGKLKRHHRFQHIYALFLYSLSTLSWVTLKDFKQTANYNQNGMTEKIGSRPTHETIFLIITKIVYFAYIIALPIIFGVAWWAVLVGFVAMHMIAGLIITIVFQLAHVVEGPKHFDPEINEGSMENTWAIHQLNSTANFACKNRFVSWFAGGLNFQIEHHLFPGICHIHYPKISEIVRNTAREFDLPYYEFPKMYKAIASHLRVLKMFGRNLQPNI